MKKSLIALAIMASAGAAFATGHSTNGCGPSENTPKKCDPVVTPAPSAPSTVTNYGGAGGTGGAGYGVGVAGASSKSDASASNHTAVGVIAGGGHATGGSSSVGNVSGGSASVGGVGNGIGNFSPKAEATIERGAVAITSSPSATGNTGTIQGGSVKDSGNSTNMNLVSTKSTVGDVGNVGSNSVSIVSGDNDSTVAAAKLAADAQVEAARIAAETNGTRDITDSREAALDRAAAIEIARLNQTVKNTPSVSGPALTSSNDTCMGSSSGSVNAPGIGVSLGTTWVDENCKMLKNSRELWNMGMKAASLALMCNDAANREALEITGFECPQTTKEKTTVRMSTSIQTPTASVNGYTGNDPIVKARMAAK